MRRSGFRQRSSASSKRCLDGVSAGCSSTTRKAATRASGLPLPFDSFLGYLATQGYNVPADALKRNVELPLEPSSDIQLILLQVYRDDSEPAQVAERLVDVDEGVQEWRYRHVKMIERTTGNKPATREPTGATDLRATRSNPVFPDLWAVRSEL